MGAALKGSKGTNGDGKKRSDEQEKQKSKREKRKTGLGERRESGRLEEGENQRLNLTLIMNRLFSFLLSIRSFVRPPIHMSVL